MKQIKPCLLLTGLFLQACTSTPSHYVPVRMMGSNTTPVSRQNAPALYPTHQANPVIVQSHNIPSGQAQTVSVSPYQGRTIQPQQTTQQPVKTAQAPVYRSTSVYASTPSPVKTPATPVAKPRGMFDLPPANTVTASAPIAKTVTAAPSPTAPVVAAKTTNMSITDVLDATIRNAPDENLTPEAAVAAARTAMPATPLENSGPGQAVASIDSRPAVKAQGNQPSKQSIAALGNEKPRFYWPVKGNVISAFGAKGSGKQNDGINITAPKGTAVKAAAAGLVVYSGEDLGGLGNLILIRHSGGYHTAYAHVDNKLVKTGDRVSIGEAIANVGKTGNVTTPQLHFEIRDGKKPVNPDNFLPRA